MARHVALLRGIGPSNPAMRNENLRGVLEDLGFGDVATVISSGNVLFESPETDTGALEARIEQAWPEKLGFTSTTIVRSLPRIERLVAAEPFGDLEHGGKSYLLVTFFKHPPDTHDLTLPYDSPDGSYRLIAMVDGALCSATDTTTTKTPDVMTSLEKRFGKEISSRTWLTVNRILRKMRS